MDSNPSRQLPASSETNAGRAAGDLPPNLPENPLAPHIRSKKVLNATTQSNLAALKESLGLLSSPKEAEMVPSEADINLTETAGRASQITFDFAKSDDFVSRTHQSFVASAPILQELKGGIALYRQKISGFETQLTSLEEERRAWQEKKREFDSKGFIQKTRHSQTGKDIEAGLKQIDLQIRTLRSEQSKLQAEVERADATLRTVESLEREAAIQMVGTVVTEVRQKYDTFQAELLADPALKRELSERFLEKELIPQLKKLQKEKKIPQEVITEYLELVQGQLEDGSETRTDYSADRNQRIGTRNKRLEELHSKPGYGYSLDQFKYDIGLYSPSAGTNTPNDGFDQLLELLLRNEQYEILHNLAVDIQSQQIAPDLAVDLVTIIDNEIDTREAQSKTTSWGEEPLKTGILDIDKITEGALRKHFLSPVSLQRWDTLKNWQGTSELFGDDGFPKLEKKIQDKSINELLITPDHNDQAIILGHRLLLFKTAEAAPIVIMNCWRESGFSGEMPFLDFRTDGGTLASRYIASLPDAELVKLGSMNIPGVMDVIKLVREHPHGFLSAWVDNPRWKTYVKTYAKKYRIGKERVEEEMRQSKTDNKLRRRVLQVAESLHINFDELIEEGYQIDNPIRVSVENGLSQMCLHLMREGGENKQFFVMHLLEKLQDTDLGPEGYKMLGDILKGTKNPKLQEALLETVMRRYADINAALAIIKSYPSLTPGLQAQTKDKGPELLTRFMKENVSLETGDIEGLAALLDINAEDIRLTIGFVREIDSLSQDHWKSSYSHEHLADFVKLAKQPEILQLVKELVPFGYEFNVLHIDTFPAILAHKEELLVQLAVLRDYDPEFRYILPYEFTYNPETKQSEQIFISDPHEILIRKIYESNNRSYAELFKQFHQIQLKEGQLPKAYSEGLLRTFRRHDDSLSNEQKATVDANLATQFDILLQNLVRDLSPEGKLEDYQDFYLEQSTLQYIAKHPDRNAIIWGFSEHAKGLLNKKFKETQIFLFKNESTLLRNIPDLKFINTLIGEFGQRADGLLRGYQNCITAGVLTPDDHDITLNFVRQFRVMAPSIVNGYKEAAEAGHEDVYMAQLKSIAERMTGGGIITDEERQKPYFQDLLTHVYPNNSGHWASLEDNNSCHDKTADITQFEISPRYEIDLFAQEELKVKSGSTVNMEVLENLQIPVYAVFEELKAVNFDKDKGRSTLGEEVTEALKSITDGGGLTNIDLDSVSKLEERLFLVITDSIYGTGVIPKDKIKELLIKYEFFTYEDVSDYISGTRDRVTRANNQDYALLCELNTFYSDRVKEVNRRLIQDAWNNPAIAGKMPQYFSELAQSVLTAKRQTEIHKLQVDKLGQAEGFIKQLGKLLEKRNNRKYTLDEVRRIAGRYEGLTGGLTDKASISKNPQTRAFYGLLKSQREKTFEALRTITGKEVNPRTVHLGEINLQQALDTEKNIREGTYNDEQFASYTTQKFIDIFESERGQIGEELDKFESASGKNREILYGYITKTKESANARMVGGVCVSGDNPSKGANNMWDMPNYFQLVLQEPDTLQCQGLALLHQFTEDGKRC